MYLCTQQARHFIKIHYYYKFHFPLSITLRTASLGEQRQWMVYRWLDLSYSNHWVPSLTTTACSFRQTSYHCIHCKKWGGGGDGGWDIDKHAISCYRKKVPFNIFHLKRSASSDEISLCQALQLFELHLLPLLFRHCTSIRWTYIVKWIVLWESLCCSMSSLLSNSHLYHIYYSTE
jgi:hypothetical protein